MGASTYGESLKREHVLVFVLILLFLSIIPYMTLFEKTEYFKVLSARCEGPLFPELPSTPFIDVYVTRNLEGFKKYVFRHDYLELPRYMFKDSHSYWVYDALREKPRVVMKIYRIVDGVKREIILTTTSRLATTLELHPQMLGNGTYLVEAFIVIPKKLSPYSIGFKEKPVCEIFMYNVNGKWAIIPVNAYRLCSSYADVIEKYVLNIESPYMALVKVISWILFPLLLTIALFKVWKTFKNVGVLARIILVIIIAASTLLYINSILSYDVGLYAKYVNALFFTASGEEIVKDNLTTVYGITSRVMLNNTDIVEVKLTDLLGNYEMKTLKTLLEMMNSSNIAFVIMSNAHYEVLGASKLPPKGCYPEVYVVSADKLNEVRIRVHVNFVEDFRSLELTIGVPKTVNAYVGEFYRKAP